MYELKDGTLVNPQYIAAMRIAYNSYKLYILFVGDSEMQIEYSNLADAERDMAELAALATYNYTKNVGG